MQSSTKSIGSFCTDAHYELPPAVHALQGAWITTFQSSAVVAALFAVLQSQLLSFFKDEIESNIGEESQSGQALLYLTYLALFFSLSAAVSSLLLTDEIGSVHIRAARGVTSDDNSLQYARYDEGSGDLLTRFNGGRSSWRWIMSHWMIALLSGYMCLVSQLVLYVWCTESSSLKGVVLFVAIITTLPILDLFPRSTLCGMRRQSSSATSHVATERRENMTSRTQPPLTIRSGQAAELV